METNDYLKSPRNHPTTNKLLELFLEEHYIVVTSLGLKRLKEVFYNIPLNDREGVFAGFLIELQSRGFNYLPEQFQADVQPEEKSCGKYENLSEVSIG